MKAGTKVIFIVSNKLKEGVILRNEKGSVLVKAKRYRYHLKPSQIARKEQK